MESQTHTNPAAGPRPAAFGSVTCGVRAARSDGESVRQAASLSAPDGALSRRGVGVGMVEDVNVESVGRATVQLPHRSGGG
jgi:hypothetical protein